MARLKELQDAWKKLATESDEIRALYPGSEKMTAADEERYDAIMDKADGLWKDIDREERALKAKDRANEPVDTIVHPTEPTLRKGRLEFGRRERNMSSIAAGIDEGMIAAHQQAFVKFLRQGTSGLSSAEVDVVKAFQVDSDTEGGYLVTPQLFLAELLKFVDDAVYIRQRARVIQLDRAESLGVPTLETDVSDADWTSELATGSEETSMRLGKRELFPHPLAKRIKLSRRLVRIAVIDPTELVRDRFAYKFGVTEEKAFLTGTGVGQPLGVFVASNDGISTGRDVASGSTTDVTADGIIDTTYSLKAQYIANAEWLMHRLVLRNVRKLKDGDGNYLWQSGLANDRQPTIMDRPYTISEFAPSTFTTGQYLAILADWRYYWIVEALGMQIQTLNELYAETNQVGYIARMELDAMPVLEEAFARLKTT